MNRKGLAIIILFIFWSSISVTAENAFTGEVWTITSLEWPPYSGAELPGQGLAVTALREALAEAGIRLQVEFYPWRRAQLMAREPGYVGYFPAWPMEVYRGFTASPPVFLSTIALLKNESRHILFKSLEDIFTKYRIGIIRSYTYPHSIEALLDRYSANADPTPDEHSLIRKLETGRIDIGITDPHVGLYVAALMGIGGIDVLKSLDYIPLVVALRDEPDNNRRIELLEQILSGKSVKRIEP